MLTFLRFASVVALSFVTIIVAPAHWSNGSSLLTVAGCKFRTPLTTQLLTSGCSMAGRVHPICFCELDFETHGDRGFLAIANIGSAITKGGHGICKSSAS